MVVTYDIFTSVFLAKLTEYDFIRMQDQMRQELVDGYMKRACAKFGEVCEYDIIHGDDNARTFTLEKDGVDITPSELDEIVDIVSLGMLVQWFTQQYYNQENMKNMLNTTDFSHYSPSELLYRMTSAFEMCKSDFANAVREYSYRHGDLTNLHS